MEIRAMSGDITTMDVDAAVVNLFEGVKGPGGATGAMDAALDGAISALIADGELQGKSGRFTLIHTLGKIPPKRVLVVGLGKKEKFDLEGVRRASAETGRYLRRLGVKRVATITHGAGIGGLDPRAAAQAMAEGALLGIYSFQQYKGKPDENASKLKELLLVEREEEKVSALQQGVETGRIVAEATALARDLVNTPANDMTPTRLAEVAGEVAREHGLGLTVLEQPDCAELGMGAFLGVAQGSNEPPKFIVLEYRGDPDNPKNNLGLIGKGITFDSGGISLKQPSGMASMKGDMSGGASVIAAMKAIAQIRPKLNVTAIVAATENMPSGAAVKPGDVLRAMNGKTIEVDNTDAEGRLTLADALCYARSRGIGRLVDIATLTGAIRTALGNVRIGVFANNQKLADRVIKAGEAAGEKMWQLPMDDEYKELYKSNVADIKNTGGSGAGAITAAHFVGEFAEGTPWVHLDIAAVFMSDKEQGLVVKGATGKPVRSLIRLAQDLGAA